MSSPNAGAIILHAATRMKTAIRIEATGSRTRNAGPKSCEKETPMRVASEASASLR